MSPRTSKQFEQIRTSRRTLIIKHAMALFADRGPANVSINEIAAAAKISKGLMYNYFKSKEALLKAIILEGFSEITEIFDPDRDGVLTSDELAFFIHALFGKLRKNKKFWRLYFMVMFQSQHLIKKILTENEMNDIAQPFFTKLINYFTTRKIKYPEHELMLFHCLMDGICMNYSMNPKSIDLDKLESLIIKRYC